MAETNIKLTKNLLSVLIAMHRIHFIAFSFLLLLFNEFNFRLSDKDPKNIKILFYLKFCNNF